MTFEKDLMYTSLNIVFTQLWKCGVKTRHLVVRTDKKLLHKSDFDSDEILQITKMPYPELAVAYVPPRVAKTERFVQLETSLILQYIDDLRLLEADESWKPSLRLPYHIHLDVEYKDVPFVMGITLPDEQLQIDKLFVHFADLNETLPFCSVCPIIFTLYDYSYQGTIDAIEAFFRFSVIPCLFNYEKKLKRKE